MDWLTDHQAWLGLLTLTALEIVLGIDNIVFISILAGKLPAAQQQRARIEQKVSREISPLHLFGCGFAAL